MYQVGPVQMFRDERLRPLADLVLTLVNKVNGDEAISILKESTLSQEFVSDRVREIVEESLLSVNIGDLLGVNER